VVLSDEMLMRCSLQIASTDFAAQARSGFAAAGQGITSGAKGAAEGFNRFIEGQDAGAARVAGGQRSASGAKVEPERKDFWDSFGASEKAAGGGGSLGTSAMKKGSGSQQPAKKDDGWGDDW
jgi:ADP-ribosylation factor GTPase-activating protein 1